MGYLPTAHTLSLNYTSIVAKRVCVARTQSVSAVRGRFTRRHARSCPLCGVGEPGSLGRTAFGKDGVECHGPVGHIVEKAADEIAWPRRPIEAAMMHPCARLRKQQPVGDVLVHQSWVLLGEPALMAKVADHLWRDAQPKEAGIDYVTTRAPAVPGRLTHVGQVGGQWEQRRVGLEGHDINVGEKNVGTSG